eukprot:294030-Chlamydomonas_euryale.AAC.2
MTSQLFPVPPPLSTRSPLQVYVGGATEVKTRTREEVADVLSRGSAARATAAHKMNSESSRSHAIITLTLEQHATSEGAGALPHELHFLRSKLHLIDLAGSERVSDTGAEGKRFAEGVNINQGLLQLGNVVNALTEVGVQGWGCLAGA